MDVSEIVDRESFQRWLEALPQGSDAERDEARRWAVLLAHRAAMRVLPGYWGWSLEEADLEKDVSAIPLLRNALIAGYAVATKAPEIWALDAASSSSYMFSFDYLANVSHNAALGALDTGRSQIGENRFAKASDTVAVVGTAASVAWLSLSADAAALVAGADPYLLPLWLAGNPFVDQWSTIRTHPSTQSPGWRFWIDWYERALTGQPQDWKLLEKVALIDPKDWDKGADHVNALILQMVEQHALLLETRRLKAENERLVEHLRALEHRSHNHPPELVEDLAPVRASTTIIWAALEDAERELGQPKPDKGALRKAAEALLTATKAVGSYCLRLADTMAQGAARAAGAALVAGAGLLLTRMNADLATLAENLLRFAASLLP